MDPGNKGGNIILALKSLMEIMLTINNTCPLQAPPLLSSVTLVSNLTSLCNTFILRKIGLNRLDLQERV